MRRLLAIGFLLAQPAGWKPPAVRILEEGTEQGYASTLNCVGAGISCSVGASVATLTVSGGGAGGGSPGGNSGNVQINSAGSFGAYTGTTCAYAVKSLDANGAATCTAAPSIPADVSGASYWTRVAESGLSNETALGALGTGIILNTTTTGVPTIYGGTSCTNQFPRSLNASGTATCAGVGLADLTATGTPDSTTFLRGDNTWAIPLAGGGGAPVGATYITQTPDATLTGEQALSSLGTGLLKNTTGTGILSIGASGTDYAPATTGSSILKGNGAGGFSNAVSGTDYQAPLTLPLSVTNGGTGGTATPTSGGVGYGTGSALAYSAAGSTGQSIFSGGTGAPSWADAQKLVRLTSDYTNATTSMTNTALAWTSPAAVSRSAFICQLMVKSSATTTGGQFDVNVSVAPTTITYGLTWITGAGTAPGTGGTSAFVQATAAATALGPATTSLTTYTLWRLEGVIVHTASAATVTVRGKAPAAGTLTVGSGSNCQYYVL